MSTIEDRIRKLLALADSPNENEAAAVLLHALLAGTLTTGAASPRGAAMKLWPALPTPGELVRLALPWPPQLIGLPGYTGRARLIALWWSPLGDELMISDGTLTETGRWRG